MRYQDLPAADRAKRLIEVTTRMITPMAEHFAHLRGRKIPEYVFDNPYSPQGYSSYGYFCFELMMRLDDALEAGEMPIGLIYEGASGTVREPFLPNDEGQVQALREFERQEEEEEQEKRRKREALEKASV
jgi:hypothetical protein